MVSGNALSDFVFRIGENIVYFQGNGKVPTEREKLIIQEKSLIKQGTMGSRTQVG